MDTKKSIITITGIVGGGKSSTAKLIASLLGFEHYSMGDVQRTYAEKQGITLAELGQQQERDSTIDRNIDQYQKSLGHEKDNFVIDSRLGWYFIPQSFKVFLTLPLDIAGDRIWEDMDKNPSRKVERYSTKEELIQGLTERINSERKRYFDFYGIKNHLGPRHFNLTVDTSKHTLPEVVAIIKEAYEKWRAN